MTHIDKIVEYFPAIKKAQILLVLQTDLSGNIVDWIANEKKKVRYQLVTETLLKNYLLYMDGVFCSEEDELLLPNMQIGESFWVNIYLKRTKDLILMGFEDTSDYILAIRSKIQAANEKKMKKSND